jgi:hypothetical protein
MVSEGLCKIHVWCISFETTVTEYIKFLEPHMSQQGDSAVGRLCLWSWFVNYIFTRFNNSSIVCGQGSLSLSVWMSLVVCLSSRAGHRNCTKRLRLSQHTCACTCITTIHWKSLACLHVTTFLIQPILGGNLFHEFSPKTSVLKCELFEGIFYYRVYLKTMLLTPCNWVSTCMCAPQQIIFPW